MEQRHRDAQPLAHAEREVPDLLAARVLERDQLEDLGDTAARDAVGEALNVEVLGGSEVTVERRRFDQGADTPQHAGRGARRIERPNASMVPPVGVSSPSSSLMVVVLPAPFGPTNPKTSPRCSVRSMSVTAAAEP